MAGATVGDLEKLQRLMVTALTQRVQQDMQDNIPTDAATLGVIAKLLKDNNVTADPADADDLANLRAKLVEQSQQRRQRNGNVIAMAKADLMAKEA